MRSSTRRAETSRIRRLERRLRSTQLAAAAGFVTIVGIAGARSGGEEAVRARTLVIEDAEGRPRVILGAPIETLAGRVRHDPTNGLVVLDERGIDRISVGSPTIEPQSGGVVGRRVSPSTGIVLNDADGNERMAMGPMADGRVTFGIDYESGEAINLFVLPDLGYTGMRIQSPHGERRQRAFLGVQYEGTDAGALALDGPNGRWAAFRLGEDGEPRIDIRGADGEMENVLRP